MQYLVEGSAEFGIEDRVDDWVQEAVNVAEPDEKREHPGFYVAQL